MRLIIRHESISVVRAMYIYGEGLAATIASEWTREALFAAAREASPRPRNPIPLAQSIQYFEIARRGGAAL